MTIENKEYSVNDLERVKFTKESNTDNSVIQTFQTNAQTHTDLTETLSQELRYRLQVTSTLECILEEIKKLNIHLNQINESEL